MGGHAYGSIYPGPVGAVLMPALQGLHKWHDLPQASSLCGACREVCPVRIDIPRMLLEHRDKTTQAGADADLGDVRAHRLSSVADAARAVPARTGAGRWATRRLATDGWIKSLPGHMARWIEEA